jgi:drug/metabolite transporter (DMT)-like permease
MNSTKKTMSPETQGLWLGLLGVVIFALTLPMTRLATGTVDAPQLSPWFVTWGRAALAGVLSAIYLLAVRASWPSSEQRGPLYLSLAGNVIGYLRHVTASHAAVITALLPLATAAAAAWLMHQRARLGFWVFAALGSSLVAVYSVLRAAQMGHGFGLTWADSLLLGAVVAASLGYVAGAKVTASLGAEKVISWVCVMALPITLPGAWLTWPTQPIATTAWLALLYVGVFSMWAGFFAWFRGLSMGGPLRVSQLQLLQPFISILAAIPLLGESLDAMTLGFALLVVLTVFMGRRMANTPATR